MACSENMGCESKVKYLNDRGASTAELLLHPELLSQDFIQLVLNEKKITTRDDGSRDQLTELYLRHVIPLPQRTLPNNRWGTRMQRARARQSGADGQRYSSNNDRSSKRPRIVFDGSSSKSGPVRLKTQDGQRSGSGVTDRLKPPPSCSLSNPIRKLSSTTLISSSPIPGGFDGSPKGNKGQMSPSSPTLDHLKREADSLDSSKSPEVKKKIQKVTWP